MARDWQDIRYRGDNNDVQELFDTYRVGDYLDTFEENRRRHDQGIREQLLKHGIRLTENLSPRIFRLFNEVCDALEIESEAEVFCLPDQEINAFAILEIREAGTSSLIGLTAGALERLDDSELKSIIGHELGHFLCGHNRMNALLSFDENNPSVTVLPSFGESLFLRWRKKAEISADRAGLLACRDFYAAARSLLKATFGLSEKNLNLHIDDLVAQIDEIGGSAEMIEEAFASHPLLPIRLKALELFSRSQRAKRNGFKSSGKLLSDSKLEKGVDKLIQLTRRYPSTPLTEAIMRTVALGGALVLAADADVSDDEVKLLVHMLHNIFTDEPEKILVTDRKEIQKQLPEHIKTILAEGDESDKGFILSRLAEVALADGALVDAEGEVILEIAEMLEVTAKQAYSVIVGTVQARGFHADVKLARIAKELRRSFTQGGMGS
ncbi:MAG: M48 family metallopeptidase [bacterium]